MGVTLIDQLRHNTVSHTWVTLGGRVSLSAVPLPDLYDADHIMVTAPDSEGCIEAMLIELAACRNDKPRLVGITTIAERWMGEVAS